MRLRLLVCLAWFALAVNPLLAAPAELHIRTDRQRDLSTWRPAIARYSLRHYGEDTAELKPTCIVLHFTAGSSFPWNLVRSTSSDGEAPGLASHYVIEGSTIWQILPPDVRSRGAYGINHRAINIEMVATNARDLARRHDTLQAAARLVAKLMADFDIPLTKVYSHQNVSRMNRKLIPEVYDRIHPEPYGKSDPGEQNMKRIKDMIVTIQKQ
jgi:N-acetyl-anhydromuramyl-L-alanine amidase AmpD